MDKLLSITQTKSIFLKPKTGMNGEGIFEINKDNIKITDFMSLVYKTIKEESYIVEETINQHTQMMELNPSSVNTVRIDTYINKYGNPEIISAALRIGRNGSVVDNANSGGFFAGINLNTGRLNTPGKQYLKSGNKYIYIHPDTKLKIEGFAIPFFEETVSLVKEAAVKLEDRLVGWDVAITQNGPLILEGNHNYNPGLQEVAHAKGYKSYSIVPKILKEIDS